MYKASVEILKLTKMKVKFSTMIDQDKQSEMKFGKIINKFDMDGNTYLKISSRSFVTLDVTDNKMKKENGWNTNDSVSLNQLGLYKFIYRFGNFMLAFRQRRNLYFYNSNSELVLNKEVADEITDTFDVGGKRLLLYPVVVQDYENKKGNQSEGCILAINTFDNSAILSYEEMECLYNALKSFDMTSSSLQLISLAEKYRDAESIKLEEHKVTEVPEIIIEDGKNFIMPEPVKEIPEI